MKPGASTRPAPSTIVTPDAGRGPAGGVEGDLGDRPVRVDEDIGLIGSLPVPSITVAPRTQKARARSLSPTDRRPWRKNRQKCDNSPIPPGEP